MVVNLPGVVVGSSVVTVVVGTSVVVVVVVSEVTHKTPSILSVLILAVFDFNRAAKVSHFYRATLCVSGGTSRGPLSVRLSLCLSAELVYCIGSAKGSIEIYSRSGSRIILFCLS